MVRHTVIIIEDRHTIDALKVSRVDQGVVESRVGGKDTAITAFGGAAVSGASAGVAESTIQNPQIELPDDVEESCRWMGWWVVRLVIRESRRERWVRGLTGIA